MSGGCCDGQCVACELSSTGCEPIALLPPRRLAVGLNHTCRIAEDRSLVCWGDNHFGQLGDGTTISRGFPAQVVGLSDVEEVSLGEDHTCAVHGQGSVSCWGRNDMGQLGDGSQADRALPTRIQSLGAAFRVDAGWNHTCAVLQDTSVACWGENGGFQLGTDQITQALTPRLVEGLTDVQGVSAGLAHTCAALADGTAQCWGTSGTQTTSLPVPVRGLENVGAVEVGGSHTCALLDDGSAWCWGFNGSGQVGDGSTENRSVPAPVAGLGRIKSLSLSGGHTCALLEDGAVACWGRNDEGQVAPGVGAVAVGQPVIGSERAVAEIAAGGRNTCWSMNGDITCRGADDLGQLGADPPSFDRLSAGLVHTCEVRDDASAACWGNNEYGQLGDGTQENRSSPTPVLQLTDVRAIAAGGAHSCAIHGSPPTISCWGWNNYGQLGSGLEPSEPSLQPVTVSVEARPLAITTGEWHTCALLQGGSVACWGENRYQQVGIENPQGDHDTQLTPALVSGLTDARAVSAGWHHTCAVLGKSRSVACWGDDRLSVNGFSPVPVEGVAGVVALSAGGDATCAVGDDGLAACWGYNAFGQLGNGAIEDRATPVPVLGVAGLQDVSIAEGRDWGNGGSGGHSCAVSAMGYVFCWGLNDSGQVGVPAGETELTPVRVPDVFPATAVSVGEKHSCAWLREGGFRCWGSDEFGQLGDDP